MKRKFFSTLLFGALACATLGTVTSCKDYDDDINNLQTEQASLLSQIEALQKSVDANKTSVAAAQQTANDALSKANANATEIAAVKTTAAEAGAKAASAAADAAEAKQKAQAALDAIGDVNIKTLAERVSSLESKVAGLETLTAGLEQLKLDVEANKIAIADAKAKLESYSNWFNSVFAMVTDVKLFGTFSGSGFTSASDLTTKAVNLEMMHGNVAYTANFGDNEALKNDLSTVFASATNPVAFTKGNDIKTSTGLLLSINPVNADLTNSKVVIVNSKGEAMDDYVEVLADQATRYNSLITTRGTSINTGLWKVPVQFKDGVDMNKFKAAIKSTETGSAGQTILYAVAVNNTDTVKTYGGDNRYVASTFDLTLSEKAYAASQTLDFTVDGNGINNIHNRWNGSTATTANEGNNTTATSTDPNEYKWADSQKNYETPNAQIISNNSGKNVTVDTSDARSSQKLLSAKVGVPFTVKLENEAISHYYVTLDENFAIESTPSELNAWKNYSYTGLNTVVKADETLDITVNNLNNVKGDVIGFRLFAVNYDGTLVDPDGRAFYVKVGDPEQSKSVDVKILASKAGEASAIVALPEGFVTCKNELSKTFQQADFDKNDTSTANDATITYQLLGKLNTDGTTYETVTDWKDAKFVKVTLNNVQNFQDGGKWTVVEEAANNVNLGDVQNVLTINVEKVMPTTTPDVITWKTAQTKDGVYYCYVEPSQGAAKAINASWNTASSYGYKNLATAVNGLSDANYEFEIANASKKNDKYTETLKVTGTSATSYQMTADAALVDNTTKHAVTVSYDYKNISYAPDKNGNLQKVADYQIKALTGDLVFTCAVDAPVQTYAWGQIAATYNTDGTVKTPAKDVNAITYESTAPTNVIATDLYKYIIATNTWDPDFGGTQKFNKLYTAIKSVELVTAEGANAGKAEYYDVTLNYNTSAFTFKLKSNTTNPNEDVKSNLNIVVTDAFGHDNTISLPFWVKQKK